MEQVEADMGEQRCWDLSLGLAYQDDLTADFLDDLVIRADEDMYRRRRLGGYSHP